MIPSSCFNTLTVTANDLIQLDQFRQKAEGIEPSFVRDEINELCFHNFIPLPIDKIKSQHLLEHYRFERWNCKSGAMAVSRKQKGKTLVYYFVTSEVPPMRIVTHLAGMYPEFQISLEYKNEALGTSGNLK